MQFSLTQEDITLASTCLEKDLFMAALMFIKNPLAKVKIAKEPSDANVTYENVKKIGEWTESPVIAKLFHFGVCDPIIDGPGTVQEKVATLADTIKEYCKINGLEFS
ncbi:MAG: hypothetical protein RSB67_00675 [Clostridia bacterium]